MCNDYHGSKYTFYSNTIFTLIVEFLYVFLIFPYIVQAYKPASRIPTIIVEVTWQYVSGGDHRNNWLSTTSYKPDDSNPLE